MAVRPYPGSRDILFPLTRSRLCGFASPAGMTPRLMGRLESPPSADHAERLHIEVDNGLVLGALVLVEESVEAAFKAPDGFEEVERRRYDTTEVTFLRLA